MIFSYRYGYKKVKDIIQQESIDEVLRNSLWNALTICYWDDCKRTEHIESAYNYRIKKLCHHLWLYYYKKPLDTIPDYGYKILDGLREYFFSCRFNEVYDFIQFVAENWEHELDNEKFRDYCNAILEREVSAYRFVGKEIVRITSQEEIAEIEGALEHPLRPVTAHIEAALKQIADKKEPDYRNTIKEAISALEAICNLITGKKHHNLSDALKDFPEGIIPHKSFEEALKKLYGYTSDADGIRHSIFDETNHPTFEDAKFMLVACSALVNYLTMKASKVGIKFTITS